MTRATRIAGGVLAYAALALGLGGLAAQSGDKAISREVLSMGTRATLTTWDDDAARGRRRLERLLQALEETEARLSTWRDDSEISRLNATAGRGPQALSASTCRLFTTLDRTVRDTGGAFDPSVGPLTAAWDIHGSGRIPSAAAVAAARSRTGWHRLSFDPVRCTLAMPPGAALDVGAFGKGDGLDAARAAVTDERAPWVIDLGGQVALSGLPRGWDIALAHPDNRTVPLLTLTLPEGSLSTSGGSERDRWVRGVRIPHHLDPRTGSPAAFNGSVSVWHTSALAADALSTALFVMGPEAGVAWADERGVAALFAIPHRSGLVERRASKAFARRFPFEKQSDGFIELDPGPGRGTSSISESALAGVSSSWRGRRDRQRLADNHAIARLRKKVEADARHPRYIHTVHGDGYRLTIAATS